MKVLNEERYSFHMKVKKINKFHHDSYMKKCIYFMLKF